MGLPNSVVFPQRP